MQISEWTLSFFPPLTLYRSSIQEELIFGTVAVLLLFVLYICISALVARFLSDKRVVVQSNITGFFTFALVIAMLRMANYSNDIPFAPVYILSVLVLIAPLWIIVLSGSWLTARKVRQPAPDYHNFVSTHMWFSILSALPLLFPLVLFQVPMIEPDERFVYIAPVSLSICLYYIIIRSFLKYWLSVTGIEISVDMLPPNLKSKFQSALNEIPQSNAYSFHIIKPGFPNAVALYPYNKIVIGIDLIEHMEFDELKAILLHEIGHLEDKKYMPLLHKIIRCFPLLIISHEIMNQLELLPDGIASIFPFIVVLFIFAIVLKKIRLRSEYHADAYVSDFDPGLKHALLSGLNTIYQMNGVNRDHCKKTNYGHLDPDEREHMLRKGKFELKRKKIMPFFKSFVVPFIIIFSLSFLYSFIQDGIVVSDAEKWRNLHNSFHKQMYSDRQSAETAILEALRLSEEEFGPFDNRTYISLNDLTEIYLLQGKFKAAEQSSIRSVHIGEKLYPNGPKKVRSMSIRAEVLKRSGQLGKAEALYRVILEFQEKVDDTAENTADTLYDLGDLFEISGEHAKAIEVYRQIVTLHQNSNEHYQADNLKRIYTHLAYTLEQSGYRAQAIELYEEGIAFMNKTFGADHYSAMQMLCHQAGFYHSIGKLDEAKTLYMTCLNGYQEPEFEDLDVVIYYQLELADVYSELGEIQNALEYAESALEHQNNLYGAQDPELSETRELIARLYGILGSNSTNSE